MNAQPERPVDPPGEPAAQRSPSGRHRVRHRKRQKPTIIVPTWRWWQLLAAVGVALLGGGLAIWLVRGQAVGP